MASPYADDGGNYAVGGFWDTQNSAAVIILFALAILLFIRWGFRGVGFSSSVAASVKV